MNKARVRSLPVANRQEQPPIPSQTVSSAVRQRIKRRAKWRNLFLLCFVAWAAYVFLLVQNPSLNRLNHQQQNLTKQQAEMQQKNQDLQKKVQQLYDPSYIAELARKKYLMVKDGETLFVEPKPQP